MSLGAFVQGSCPLLSGSGARLAERPYAGALGHRHMQHRVGCEMTRCGTLHGHADGVRPARRPQRWRLVAQRRPLPPSPALVRAPLVEDIRCSHSLQSACHIASCRFVWETKR